MKQDLKEELKKAFEPPAPEGRDRFLKSMPRPKISNPAFILSQAVYIRKYVWGISGLIFGIALAGTWTVEKNRPLFFRNLLYIQSILLFPYKNLEHQCYKRSHIFQNRVQSSMFPGHTGCPPAYMAHNF